MNIPQQNHILIGLGGTGGRVLKAFKKRLFQEFTSEERKKLPIGFLYVDTDPELMHNDKSWYVFGESAQFHKSEWVYLKEGVQIEQILASPNSYPGLKGVVGDPEVMQKSIGTLSAAAGQMRRVGRILFGANVAKYRTSLENVYNRVNDISHSSGTCIYIFGGLAGGTGSGSIVDVVAQTRMIPAFQSEYQTLGDGKAVGTNIVVYCMIPEITPPAGSDEGRYHANGYAALREINGLFSGTWKPIDLTGMSPTGRLNFENIKKVADGLMVYTNENENGFLLDSKEALPQVVSDFVFCKVFMEFNDKTTGDFIRSASFENISELNENYEKAKNGAIIPYRTKIVGSFGIKRVVVPDEEIKEYFTFSLSHQALLRLRYNNWNDDIGYRNAPSNIDWGDYVRGQDKKLGNPLQNWHFTDKHVILDDCFILPSDEGKWASFSSYWGKAIPRWLMDAQNTSQPIAKLDDFCAKGLESGFRGEGVTNFFTHKKEDARDKSAEEIVQRMEADIFDKWSGGTFSLYNLLELVDAIIAETQSRMKSYEDRIVQYRKNLDKLGTERAEKAEEYTKAGTIMRAIKGKQMLANYSVTMQKICQKRTEVEGYSFAVDLLRVLINKERDLRSRIEKFVGLVNDAIEDTEKQVGALCKDAVDTENLEGTVIRYYDQSKVKAFTQRMIHNKKDQENISSAVLGEIVKLIGSEKTFARANAAIDGDVLNDIFEKTVREKVVSIHNDTLIEAEEKLINRSILEQLSEKYSSAEEMRQFAEKLIQESKVLIRFNSDEVKKSVANNPTTEEGKTIMRRCVLVNMPKVEGNDKVLKFAENLKTALENATSASTKVKVDMSGEKQNEIDVMSLAYYFPVRVLQNLSFYKEKYDYLTTPTATVSESEVRKHKVILYGEGFGGEGLPELQLLKEKQKSQLRKEYMSYFMLAYAMGIIKYGDLMDGTGRKAYGTVELDEDLGLEKLQLIAGKFSEIGYSERFTEDLCEEIETKVKESFRHQYLHVENRINELRPKVQSLLRETILPETGNNQGSQEFLEFVDAAKKAIEILKNQ